MILDRMRYATDFGINLKAVMRVCDITQRMLSEKTNITQASISKILNGQSIPSITTVIAFAQALGVTYDTLLEPFTGIEYKDDFFDNPLDELDWLDEFARNLECLAPSEYRSQAELADITGINQGTLSKYLNQKTIPNAYAVYRIVHGLAYQDCYDELIDFGRIYINRRY